jgi:hypothetical protein
MYLKSFTFKSELCASSSDLISPEEAQREAAKAKDVLRIIKGLKTEGQFKLEEEKITGTGSPSISDVIYLLLRIEERIIQLEAKLDSLRK